MPIKVVQRWNRPVLFKIIVSLGIALIFSACGSDPVPQPESTSTEPQPSPTRSATSQPSLTPTDPPPATPTFTNTVEPVNIPAEAASLTETPIPKVSQVIDIGNAANLAQISRWGKGRIYGKVLTAPGQVWVLTTPLGVYLYNAQTMEEIAFLENGQQFKISPDGEMVAIVYADGLVELRRNVDGSLLSNLEHELEGEEESPRTSEDELEGEISEGYSLGSGVTALTFSPGGNVLAIGYSDANIVFWRLSDASKIKTLIHDIIPPVDKIIFSPGGDYLATGTRNDILAVWSLGDNSLIWRTANGGSLIDTSFSPDGETLLTLGLESQKLLFWKLNDGRLLKTLGTTNFSSFAGFLDGGSKYALLTRKLPSGRFYLEERSLSDGKLDRVEEIPANFYLAPNRESTIAQDDAGSIRQFSHQDWSWRTIAENTNFLGDLIISSEGETMALSADKEMAAWRLSDNGELYHQTFDEPVFELFIRGLQGLEEVLDEGLMAWGMNGLELFSWKVSDGEVDQYMLGSAAINQANPSPDGLYLAVCTEQGIELIRRTDGHRENLGRCKPPGYLAFSPVEDTLANASAVRIDLLQMPHGERENYLIGNVLPLKQIAYSPDGTYLAGGTEAERGGAEAIIWQLARHLFPSRVSVPSYGVDALAFSPDNIYLATGGGDDRVRFWRVEDGWLLRVPKLGRSAVSMAFAPDGSLVAIGLSDGTLRLLSVPDGQELVYVREHAGSIVDTVFSTDGTAIYTASRDGTIRMWGIR